MKKFIIYISLLLTFLIIQKENTFAFCCDSIQIQVSYFDNCCIQLEVINPSCLSAVIYFDQFDTANNIFIPNDTSEIDVGDTARSIYCTKYNETNIIYRVRIGDAATYEYDPE